MRPALRGKVIWSARPMLLGYAAGSMTLCRVPLSFPFHVFLIRYRCTSIKCLPNFSGKTTSDTTDSPLLYDHRLRLFLVAQSTRLTFNNNRIRFSTGAHLTRIMANAFMWCRTSAAMTIIVYSLILPSYSRPANLQKPSSSAWMASTD